MDMNQDRWHDLFAALVSSLDGITEAVREANEQLNDIRGEINGLPGIEEQRRTNKILEAIANALTDKA